MNLRSFLLPDKDALTKLVPDIFRNLLAVYIILLVFSYISPGYVEFYIDLNNFIYPLIVLGAASLLFYAERLESSDRNRFDVAKKRISYAFLGLLLIVAVQSIAPQPALEGIKTPLMAAAVALGAITFYLNRDKLGEIEEEARQEEVEEKRREMEFAGKYPRVNRVWGLRWAARWMYKEGWWYSVGLIAIVILGYALRIWVGMTTNPDLDEGQLIYDAKLTGDGLIPFKDFTTRAPLLVYVLLFINKFILGGFYLLSSKILISLIFSLSSIGIYLLSKEIFKNRKISILSMLLFNVVPWLFFYSIVLHVAQASILPLIFFCLFFIKFLKSKNDKHLFLSGLILGLGYLIRRDLIIYLVPALLYLLIDTKKISINLFKQIFAFGIGFIAGLSPLLYFVIKTDFAWVDKFYGISSLLNQTVGISTPTNQWPIFFIFFISTSIFLMPMIFCLLRKKQIIYFSLLSILFYYSILNSYSVIKTGGFNIYQSPLYNLYLTFGTIFGFVLPFIYRSNQKDIFNKRVGFLYSVFFFYYIVVFLMVEDFQSSYFISTLFIPILFFSQAFLNIKKSLNTNKTTIWLIVSLLIIFIFFLNIDILNSYKYERSWDLSTIKKVNVFLKNTSSDEYIFTVGYTLVVDSQKDIVFNITHHRVYDSTKCYNERYKALVCLDDLGKLFEGESIKYIVLDQRTEGLINNYDKLSTPFYNNYRNILNISPSVSVWGLIK